MKLMLISKPDNFEGEIDCVNQMFENGLFSFHLRKPDLSVDEMRSFLDGVSKRFHDKIVLHSAFELINEYDLKGLHFNFKSINSNNYNANKVKSKSFSAHSFDEILALDNQMSYFFLSPIFDSISKNGYKSKFEMEDLKNFIKFKETKSGICALGGICLENIKTVNEIGFDYCAVMGAVWQQRSIDIMLQQFIQLKDATKNS